MTPSAAIEPLSVIVLAGGASTRMGQNKLWLTLDGQPLIERVLRRIRPISDDIIISANEPAPYARSARTLGITAQTVTDHYAGAGPLAGLHAGLLAARHDLTLLIAGDMPFISIDLVRTLAGLAQGYQAVIPMAPVRHVAKRRYPQPERGALVEQTLHALYRRSCLPAIARRLDAGEHQMLSFYADVRTRYVAPETMQAVDPGLLSFFNVNTPDDWQEAQRLAHAAGQKGTQS